MSTGTWMTRPSEVVSCRHWRTTRRVLLKGTRAAAVVPSATPTTAPTALPPTAPTVAPTACPTAGPGCLGSVMPGRLGSEAQPTSQQANAVLPTSRDNVGGFMRCSSGGRLGVSGPGAMSGAETEADRLNRMVPTPTRDRLPYHGWCHRRQGTGSFRGSNKGQAHSHSGIGLATGSSRGAWENSPTSVRTIVGFESDECLSCVGIRRILRL